MKQKVLNVGVLGLGRSGYDIHIKWLREVPKQYRIVAVTDEIPSRRAEVAKEFGCKSYKTYKDLFSHKDLDLVVNATPSFLHPKATIAALQAGHNVVCEKPFATKVSDVDRMIEASKKARKMLAPFQNSRFFPFFVKVQQVIASGKLGQIVHIRMNWSGFSRRWDWQTRKSNWGGNLNNTGPHAMDQAVMLFGNKAPQVFSRMGSFDGSSGDADDFTLVTLYGKNSPTIEVALSSYQAYKQGDMISVSGTLGGLTGGPDKLQWKYYDPAKAGAQKLDCGWAHNRGYCGEKLPWKLESWRQPKTKLDAFQLNSRAFYDNIHDVLTGKGKLVVTPAQVRRQIAVIEQCHRQNPLKKR